MYGIFKVIFKKFPKVDSFKLAFTCPVGAHGPRHEEIMKGLEASLSGLKNVTNVTIITSCYRCKIAASDMPKFCESYVFKDFKDIKFLEVHSKVTETQFYGEMLHST